MEFDEIKKVWDVQNNEPMFVINESALRKSIVKQKNKGIHITNISELICIVVYLIAGIVDIITGVSVLGVWMLIVSAYCLIGRIRRKIGEKEFDRTMLGDLDHAVDIANYQVRFSALMQWNLLPVTILLLWGMWGKLDSIALIVGVTAFAVITFYASRWEHSYYKERLRQVVTLRETLRSSETAASGI